MINMIIKRDGRIVPYDETRIRTAIALSVTNIDETDLSNIISNIMEKVNSKLNELDDSFTAVDIETVQDIVVSSMKECGYSKIAKNFTAYRNKRTHIREKKSNLMRSIKEVAVSSSMGSDAKRENGNINGDTAMGTMLKFGTTTSKEYYLNDVIPDYISNAHREGYIHIHDLDFFGLTTTCLTADTKILLKVNNRFIHTTFSYFDDYFSSDEENKNNGFNREFNELLEHIKTTLSEKTIIIKRLKASLAVSAKAFNDTIRVYEAKLIEFGLPPEELGFQLLETNTSKMPAGLVSD